jgi:hypothetical protein
MMTSIGTATAASVGNAQVIVPVATPLIVKAAVMSMVIMMRMKIALFMTIEMMITQQAQAVVVLLIESKLELER